MRRTLAARCVRRIAAAVALAAGLPCAAEARMGGGGVGLGGGGFGPGGLGGFHGGGGFGPGGVVVVPRGAVGVVGAAQRGAIGVFGSAQRRGIGVFSTAQRGALGFRNGGVVVFRGGHAFPHGDVFAFSRGHAFPHGYGDGRSYPSFGYGWGYGGGYPSYGWGDRYGYATPGIPPLLGTSGPPLATATAPRSGRFAGPRPVRSDMGVAEVWRWDGGAWRLDPTPPQSVAAWRRGDDGRWRAEAAELGLSHHLRTGPRPGSGTSLRLDLESKPDRPPHLRASANH